MQEVLSHPATEGADDVVFHADETFSCDGGTQRHHIRTHDTTSSSGSSGTHAQPKEDKEKQGLKKEEGESSM